MGLNERVSQSTNDSDLTVGIIGLGYVGLPTAIGFHDADFTVWGVDVSQRTVDMVLKGQNPTGDPDVDDIVPGPGSERWNITTSTADAVPHCDVVLVTVPTPITHDLKPDLSYVEAAGRAVFEAIPKGSNTIVVLESTVYPGVTAQTWMPIIEELGLEIGKDLEIAYCPERFNPGDPAHGVRQVARSLDVQIQTSVQPWLHCTVNSHQKTFVMSVNSKLLRLPKSLRMFSETSTSLLSTNWHEFSLLWMSMLKMFFLLLRPNGISIAILQGLV